MTVVQPLKKLLHRLWYSSCTRKLSGAIVSSKMKKIEIPELPLTNYVWNDLDKWHNKIALECAETGRHYLYSDVYKKSNKIAQFLNNYHGLQKGDVIATILPNVPEFVIVLFGIVKAGFKITTINPSYTEDELIHCFKSSEPKLIFTLTELWTNTIFAVRKWSKKSIPVVVINHREEVMDIPSGAIKLNEIFQIDYEENNLLNTWDENDVIYLPYSSGTTGLPKCIEITSKNVVACVHHQATPEFRIQMITDGDNQDVLPAVLPMHHVFGINAIILNMALGCKAITVSKFTPKTFLTVLKHKKPTYCYLVPPLVQLLVNEPLITANYITQMRTLAIGAAPLGTSDVERLHEKTEGKVEVLQGYGLTETTGSSHWQTQKISGGLKIGGAGLLYANNQAKVESLSGEMLGPKQEGIIFLRGPQTFKGYLNNMDSTRSVLDSEGWLNTGDIGFYDEDGHVFITDRLKEMIKVKGFQVAPAELEAILRSHPDVRDAAVTRYPHDQFGEVPKAFIVPKNNQVNLKNIEDYVASKVSKHKHLLGGIVIVDYIPKSVSGKILRRLLE